MKKYNPENQHRCTIIRGKGMRQLDDLLPRYAQIINDLCPCHKEEFDAAFNERLHDILSGVIKTMDNHRTEIAGKLFGMYFVDENDIVYASERTLRYISNGDQPEFFKDICFKLQFPNGMDSLLTMQDKMEYGISIRPISYLLNFLMYAESRGVVATRSEIGYFILNNLDVLQGGVNPKQVYDQVVKYRKDGIEVKVETPGKETSYTIQHIREQLNLMEVANLIRTNGEDVHINPVEKEVCDYISQYWDVEPDFKMYDYDIGDLECRKELKFKWQKYYSHIHKTETSFETTIEAIQFNLTKKVSELKSKTPEELERSARAKDNMKLGDDGEEYVYRYEKERVAQHNKRLANKVILLGKTKGIGYDIQSVIADGTAKSEFVKFIEVKSTKRTTLPKHDSDWKDSFGLTRNEWVAAQQYGESYSFYRVYFTSEQTVVYIITDPYGKDYRGELRCLPLTYRLDFTEDVVDKII